MVLVRMIRPIEANLLVPDDTIFFIRETPRNIWIRLSRAEGARLYSYTGENFSWIPGMPGVNMDLDNRVNAVGPEGQEVAVRTIRGTIADGRFQGGTWDSEHYTWAEIAFEIDDEAILDDDEQYQELKRWTESVLQNLVHLYQLVTGEADVAGTRIDHSAVVDVWVANRYTFTPNRMEADFRLKGAWLSWSSALKPFFKPLIHADKLAYLCGLVQGRVQPKVWQRLMLEAVGLSQNRGEHDLAIVTLETAFEIYFKEILQAYCESRNVLELPDKRGRGPNTLDRDEAMDRADVRELFRFVKYLTGADVRGGREGQAWYDNAYEPRNQIAHGGTRGYSEDDVRAALEAVNSLMTVIDRTLS